MLPPFVIFTDGSPDGEETRTSMKIRNELLILNRGILSRGTSQIALWTLMAFTESVPVVSLTGLDGRICVLWMLFNDTLVQIGT
jgi:hypothetical protein